MNRYSQVTTSQFDPMSLNEQIMLPLALQKKHDDQLEAQDAISTELYNIKRLQSDDELVNNTIKEYQSGIDELSSKLASEGVNRGTTSKFRDLYNKYKYDVSESGFLGKAQNNYNTAKEKEKLSLQQMLKDGYSLEQANSLIKEGYSNFKGTRNSDGSFNEFEDFSAPTFRKYQDEAKNYFKALPANITNDQDAFNSITYERAPNGAYVARVKNTVTNQQTANNAQQIANGINAMITEYSSEDAQKFLNTVGVSQEQFINEINQIGKSFTFSKNINTNQSKESLQVLGKPNSGSNTKEYKDPNNIYTAKGSTRPVFNDASTKEEVEANIANAETPAEARRIKQFYNYQKNKFENTSPIAKRYNNVISGMKEEVDALQGIENRGIIGNGQVDIKTNNFDTSQLLEGVKNGGVGPKEDGTLYISKDDNGTYSLLSRNNNSADSVLGSNLPKELIDKATSASGIQDKYNDAFNKSLATFEKNNIEFQMTDLKSSDRTTLNTDLVSTLRNASSNEFTITAGTVFDTNSNESENLFGKSKGFFSGSYMSEDSSEEDQKELMNMVSNPNTKVEFLSYISENHTGNPAIKIQVTPNDNNDDFGGSTLQLTIDLDNLNNPGTSGNAVDNLILDRFGKLGGVQGAALKNKGKQRIKYKNIQPTFSSDFSISNDIKTHLTEPISNSVLKDKDLDINMIGDKYTLDVKTPGSNDTHSFGWGDMLEVIPAENTVERLKALSPKLMSKLVSDVKQYLQIQNFDETSEEQVDAAVLELSDKNLSITTDDYYNLLDLFSN